MTLRDELTILRQSIQKATQMGYLTTSEGTVTDIDIVLDPPSLVVHRSPPHTSMDSTVYLEPLFPLYDRDWAIAFWGNDMTGDVFFGMLPAWKYHQHKLLEFVQNYEQESFYKYIQVWC